MNNFLTETIRVMFSYGILYILCGLMISSAMAIGASRFRKRNDRVILGIAATLVLWIAMFLAADSGYRAWQGIPNPPEEAFSDTGPVLFLIGGWLPSLVFVMLLNLAGRRFMRDVSTSST